MLNYVIGILALIDTAVISAPVAKNFSKLKLLTGGAIASTGYYFSPHVKHLQESDESLNFWKETLSRSPEGDFLFRNRLYPRFVIHGRYKASEETVFLNSLFDCDTDFSKRLLEAGADPNVIGKRGRDFFEYARRYDFPSSIVIEAIKHGLNINRRSKDGLRPLDLVLKARNYELAAVLIRAGAVSDSSWSDIVRALCDDNFSLPKEPHHLKNSSIYEEYRLIIEVYRAAGRDKAVLSAALWDLLWTGRENMKAFLKRIEEFDAMLAHADDQKRLDETESDS